MQTRDNLGKRKRRENRLMRNICNMFVIYVGKTDCT